MTTEKEPEELTVRILFKSGSSISFSAISATATSVGGELTGYSFKFTDNKKPVLFLCIENIDAVLVDEES